MDTPRIACIIIYLSTLFAGNAIAFDCSDLPDWKRQQYYLYGDQVQYRDIAYVNIAESSKRDKPDPDYDDPWFPLGACEPPDGGGGGGGGEVQPISIYGVWHCGNSFCDWSQLRNMANFDKANRWIIDADGNETYRPSVNLVVLSFLKPMELLEGATNSAFLNGIPRGMTPEVVRYFTDHGIRVLLSMGGVTYTDSWNEALVTDPTELAWRAAADWLPNNKIAYINAMVPRGEPSTDQWQEHVDGKPSYAPPILPKAPAKVAVSLWLTNGRKPNPNCIRFADSSQLAKADYVQTVQPNGAGVTPGFLGYMFWAAECPSTRNICTTPPNACEGGMGVGASDDHFAIQPLDFGALRAQ